MTVRSSEAVWEGGLQQGRGTMRLGKAWEGAYSFDSRFSEGQGTNPEELLAAAHAGCFSMALAATLEKAGRRPDRVETRARVHLEKSGEGFRIPKVELFVSARVPGLDETAFREQAETAKQTCPVSQLFQGAEVVLADVRLESAT